MATSYSKGLPSGASVSLVQGAMTVDVRPGCRSNERIGEGYNRVAREWCNALRREGYMLALERVAAFGDRLHGDSTLTEEERSVLIQAAAALTEEAPGKAE